jgi:hypothetical protein
MAKGLEVENEPFVIQIITGNMEMVGQQNITTLNPTS